MCSKNITNCSQLKHISSLVVNGMSEKKGQRGMAVQDYLCWWQVLWQQTTWLVTNVCSVICWGQLTVYNYCFCCVAANLSLTDFSLTLPLSPSTGSSCHWILWNKSGKHWDFCGYLHLRQFCCDAWNKCADVRGLWVEEIAPVFLRLLSSHDNFKLTLTVETWEFKMSQQVEISRMRHHINSQ